MLSQHSNEQRGREIQLLLRGSVKKRQAHPCYLVSYVCNPKHSHLLVKPYQFQEASQR